MGKREEGQRQTDLGRRGGEKCRTGGMEMRHRKSLKERQEIATERERGREPKGLEPLCGRDSGKSRKDAPLSPGVSVGSHPRPGLPI